MATRAQHDSLAKYTFGNPRHAEGLFRSWLPEEVVRRVDWATLELQSGSFVDEALGRRHTDLLYRVELEGQAAFLYLLFEHQSTVDPLMAFRLLRYVVRIWDRWLQDHDEARMLPAVIPLVLYNGAEVWSAPIEMLELIDLDSEARAAIADCLPRFRFLLDDLARVTEEEIRGRRGLSLLARVALGLLRAMKLGGLVHEIVRDPTEV